MFSDKLNESTLAKIAELTQTAKLASDAFKVAESTLNNLQLSAYKSRTTVSRNSMALGDSSQQKIDVSLPGNFSEKNSSIINEFNELEKIASDTKAALRVFKFKTLEEMAIKKVKEYEEISKKLADVHALIGAIEKHKGNFNSGLWNKIRIPAATNINRLQERAAKPFGAAMLAYEHKAVKLTEVYRSEIKTFLER